MDHVLRQHQDGILDSLCKAKAMLDSDLTPNVRHLAELRWQLAREIDDYVHYKHEVVFPPLIGSSNAFIVKLARDMQQRCDVAVTGYKSFVSTWNEIEILGSELSYRAAALEMVRTLSLHVERESVDIKQLVGLSRFPSLAGTFAQSLAGSSVTKGCAEPRISAARDLAASRPSPS